MNAIPVSALCRTTAALALLATIAAGPALRAQGPRPDAPKDPAGRLTEMGRVVKRIRIERDPAVTRTAATPWQGPLSRWNDPTRQFSDGTLWVCGDKSRPLALAAVELYPLGRTETYWSCELTSLAPGPLAARFDGPFAPFGALGRPTPGATVLWSPGGPALAWSPLPGAPAPATGETVRLRQMRELAQRFTAHEVNQRRGESQRYELRLLPRPVHRYNDPEADVRDGALFLFANGTNPEVVLLLEARGEGPSASWSYSLARLSRAAPSVRLDGREVWSAPYASQPAATDAYYIVSTGRDGQR